MSNYLIHAVAKGSQRKNHKYVARMIVNGEYKYFYTQEEYARWIEQQRQKEEKEIQEYEENQREYEEKIKRYAEEGKAMYSKLEKLFYNISMKDLDDEHKNFFYTIAKVHGKEAASKYLKNLKSQK